MRSAHFLAAGNGRSSWLIAWPYVSAASLAMLLCAPMGAAHSAPIASDSRSLLVASGPMKHGAMARRLTPISFSRIAPS